MDPRVLHRPALVPPALRECGRDGGLLTSSLGENASPRIGGDPQKNRWQVLEEEMWCLPLASVHVPGCVHPHVPRSTYKQRSTRRIMGLTVPFPTDFVLFLLVWS